MPTTTLKRETIRRWSTIANRSVLVHRWSSEGDKAIVYEKPVMEVEEEPNSIPGLEKKRRSRVESLQMYQCQASAQNTSAAVRTVVNILSESWAAKRRQKKHHKGKQRVALQDQLLKHVIIYGRLWNHNTMIKMREKEERVRPYVKFRRIAKAVTLLMKVCRICKDIVTSQVSGEEWYRLVDTYIQDEGAELYAAQKKRSRPFVTFVPDGDNRELVQLTFDKSEFAREFRADHLLTDEVRDLLLKKISLRNEDENLEILRFMKRVSTDFNAYPLYIQRQMVKCLYYDKYQPNRVITRQAVSADGVYFLLSGTLIEKSNDSRGIKEIKPGNRFGEEDLVCGCMRKATIITRTMVEMLSIHKFDYRAIFNMADNTSDPKHLEVTKHDVVFQHFPVKKLIDNPGVWTVLSYKFGRLIVLDSNELEWIYIIKSGEARVIKHLRAGSIDLNARRRKIKERVEKTDPFFNASQMIDFVASEGDSNYSVGRYHPPITPRLVISAPLRGNRTSSRSQLSSRSLPSTPFANHQIHKYSSSRLDYTSKSARRPHQQMTSGRNSVRWNETQSSNPRERRRPRSDTTSMGTRPRKEEITPRIRVSEHTAETSSEHDNIQLEPTADNCQEKSDLEEELSVIAEEKTEGRADESAGATGRSPEMPGQNQTTQSTSENGAVTSNEDGKELDVKSEERKSFINEIEFDFESRDSGRFISTPSTGIHLPEIQKRKGISKKYAVRTTPVPPFVQLESLHAGKCFGLRACLEPEEMGPPASLVSGGCEVLQINKKFFMKHSDEAIFSLIRVQHKAFPTEDELIDRLDANIQWVEFKRDTVVDFMKQMGRTGDLTYGHGQPVS